MRLRGAWVRVPVWFSAARGKASEQRPLQDFLVSFVLLVSVFFQVLSKAPGKCLKGGLRRAWCRGIGAAHG